MSKKHKNQQKPQKKQHQQDINESDLQTEFIGLLGDDYVNNGNLKVAQKILGDYKTLLGYQPTRFWATISYNLSLQNSLDLFLRYAPRRHFLQNSLQLTSYYGLVVKEIFKSVFAIYYRLSDLEQEDSILFEQINAYEVLYQKWIFDIMKLTDICTIYGESNKQYVKKMCQFLFKYNAYQDDYKTAIDSFIKNIQLNLYENLFRINNQSANETSIIITDVQQKMEQLTLLLDSIETVFVWAEFFPSQLKFYLFKIELITNYEQIFYELILAKGYSRGTQQLSGTWKLEQLGNMQNIVKQALQRIIEFFVLYFTFLQELLNSKQMKQLQEHMLYIVQQFGVLKRKFKGKKGVIKEWILLEAITESGFSVIDFLNSIPLNQINLPRDDIEEVILLMSSVIEERDLLKNKEQENFDDLEPYIIEESTLPKEEEEQQQDQQQEQQEEEIIKDEPKEEKLVEIVSKKKQRLTFDQSIKERIEMAEITIKMYNDEPDDTYDYQEALQRPEKEYTSSDDNGDDDDLTPHQQYHQNPKVFQRRTQHHQDQNYSQSFHNLDNQQIKIYQKQKQTEQNKNQDQAKFSDDEEPTQQQQNKSGKNGQQMHYYIKDNQNGKKNQKSGYKRNDDDYRRDDEDYKNDSKQYQQKQQQRNRDGAYVQNSKSKQQQNDLFYAKEEPINEVQGYKGQYKNNNNNNNNNRQGNNLKKTNKKQLNTKSNKFEPDDLYVEKGEKEERVNYDNYIDSKQQKRNK